MRIVFVMHGAEQTGGHKVVFEYCNRLAARSHDVSVAVLGFRGDHAWFPLKVPITYSREGRIFSFYNYAARQFPSLPRLDAIEPLARLIPPCDVAVATYSLTATAVWRSPSCATRAYFAQHFEPNFFTQPYLSRWARETYHLPLAKAANSTWLRNQIAEEIGETVPVINPGIDLSVFRPRDASRSDRLKRVVAFAKAHPWKGFSDLMEALRIVERTRDDVELITYGSWQPPQVLKRIRMRHLSRPSDEALASLYSSADAVVTPSWFESFPLPPLEAMACGSPVVTTSIGTEDYAQNTQNALIVPPREPSKLAEALLELFGDASLSDRIRKKGIETATRFTWDSAVERMESFLTRTAEPGSEAGQGAGGTPRQTTRS